LVVDGFEESSFSVDDLGVNFVERLVFVENFDAFISFAREEVYSGVSQVCVGH
jgi:hypothetical protein